MRTLLTLSCFILLIGCNRAPKEPPNVFSDYSYQLNLNHLRLGQTEEKLREWLPFLDGYETVLFYCSYYGYPVRVHLMYKKNKLESVLIMSEKECRPSDNDIFELINKMRNDFGAPSSYLYNHASWELTDKNINIYGSDKKFSISIKSPR